MLSKVGDFSHAGKVPKDLNRNDSEFGLAKAKKYLSLSKFENESDNSSRKLFEFGRWCKVPRIITISKFSNEVTG